MAPNKFATMINRETNRITLVLVYAVLEWTLIIFLLLNSLFSYLIIKFANYFGLKPPCVLCSRIDHIFEPPNSKFSYRDLICEHHGIELSRSGYCFNHGKLVESQDMCEDCWSSHHGDHQHPTTVISFRWLKEIGIVKSDGDYKVVEDFEVNLRCSCCGVAIKNEILAPHTQKAIRDELVDFDGVLEDTHKASTEELLHAVNFLKELEENRRDSLGKEGKDEEGIGRSRDIQMGPYSDLARKDDNLEGFCFRLSKDGCSLVDTDEDEKDVLEDPQRENIDELLHVVNFLGEPDHKRTDLLGREGKDEEKIERSIDIQMGPYSDVKREDDNLEGLSFRLSKEGYSLVETDEDEKDMLLEDPQKANKDELPHVVHFLEEVDQNETDSLGKEGKDEEGIKRSRDIQMGPYSELKGEDDVIEGFSFLSKEGYSLVEADEDDKDVVLEGETEPLLKSSSASMSYLYADEKIIPQHLEFYIDLDHSQLIPVDFADIETEKSKGERRGDREEDLKNRDQEKFNELWRETDDGLVLEPDIMFAPSALDAVEKLNSSSLEFLELYETKIDELSSKQGQEYEMIRDIDIGVESDEAKVEDLSNEKDQGEEIKREVGTAVVIDKHKVEILPSIKCQVEMTTEEINFHVAGEEKCVEESEVTELNANIITADFEDVCHKEIDEIDIVSNVESINKSQEAESLRPCKDECPSTNNVICEASVSSNGLLEKEDYEPMQIEETQIHKDMTVKITELELQSDVEVSHEHDELEGDIIPETLTPANSNSHEEISFLQKTVLADAESLDDIIANELNSGDIIPETLTPADSNLHTEISLLQRTGSADAETLDDIIANELNSGEEVVTVEELKALLESERKMLRALYTELDEERNAAAIAISETMSMTNRLQRMDSSDAKTMDDSIANELTSGEEIVTVEELKALLESERKTLRALYTELDEERNAASVATNETMAMINRLQEDKSTIEMEALQYQRMMEEQCEYDQEALQLMNEMLVNREKQLQDLEKELEICRKKLMDYEERERMRLSINLNNEPREGDNSCKLEENGHHQNTPVDAILDLRGPLSSFEEERISILEQLKILEEKLCNLAEEEEHHIGNMKPFDRFYEENAEEFDRSSKINGDSNGYHQEKFLNGSMPKQLLPLFDAAEIDSDDELLNGNEDGSDISTIHKATPTKFELEKKRLAIEDEVDHLYERLNVLEADGEFVKHCVGSLKKGDRGLHLLQEILEHLRDLKCIELQASSVC